MNFSIIVAAPKWKNPPRDVNAHPGDNATIVCDADGFPEPSVQWYINGVDMDSKSSKKFWVFFVYGKNELILYQLNYDYLTNQGKRRKWLTFEINVEK